MLPNNVAAAAAQALNANPAMLDTVLATADPVNLANILNSGAAAALIAGLIPLLNEGAAQAIASGVNLDAAQTTSQSMIRSLIMASDAEVVADAVNSNGDFLAGVLENLNATAAAAIADGMNANPDTARAMAHHLDGGVGSRIAEAISSNTAILEPLLANLSPEVGRAIAEGLNNNTTSLSTQLMAGLSNTVAEELAAGLNANAKLITSLLPELDGNTGIEIAMGLNEGAAKPDPVTGLTFLEVTVGALSPDTADAIGAAMNTPPHKMDAFLANLIQYLNDDTARAVAEGLNGNPGLVENLIKNLDGAGAAEQLNANGPWLQALVENLDADALGSALNTALASAGGKEFLADLLNTMDGTIVGTALQNNQQLTMDLLSTASEIGLGATFENLFYDVASRWPAQNQPITPTNPEALAHWKPVDFLTDLFNNLDASMIVDALNESLTMSDPNMPVPGYPLLSVLWIKMQAILELMPILSLPMWMNIFEAEAVNY